MTEPDAGPGPSVSRRRGDSWHWASLAIVFVLLFGVIPYQQYVFEAKRDNARQIARQQGRIEGFTAMVDAFDDMRVEDQNFNKELAYFHTMRFLYKNIRNRLPPQFESIEAFRDSRKTPYRSMHWL